MSRNRWWPVTLALAGWLAAAGPAQAVVVRAVRDEGKFFSDKARAEADKKIAEIRRAYGKDLLVETFDMVSEDKILEYSPKYRGEFFQAWLIERARAAQVNGVCILVCRNPGPPHFWAEAGKHTEEKAFTRKDRNDLIDSLTDKFKAKQYDDFLLGAVDFVAARLKANGCQPEAPPPKGAEWAGVLDAPAPPTTVVRGPSRWDRVMAGRGGWVIAGLGAAVGVWLVVGLGRAVLAGGGQGGGREFSTALLSGLFGAAAGNWLYHSFFGGGAQPGDGPDPGGAAARGRP